jgi:rod shape-determining protein MreD
VTQSFDKSRFVALVAAAVVIQLAVMPKARIFGVQPEILMLVVLVVGITGGPRRGAVTGFAFGAFVDIMSSFTIGFTAGAYALAGFGVGAVSDDTTEYSWVVSLITALGSIATVAALAIVGNAIGEFNVGLWRVVTIGLVVGLVNAVLAPLLAKFMRSIWTRPRGVNW